MERWQAERLRRVRADLDEFIARCDTEVAKLERQKREAQAARRKLSGIEDFT